MLANPIAPPPAPPAASLQSAKLGEELPVFCERCGYSLHGLAQLRCEHCTLLQFHCPECGHRQPINTLRPAAQTILGRIRGGWLVMVVFFKLNMFGWALFGWVGMGAVWAYTYGGYYATVNGVQQFNASLRPIEIRWETMMGFTMYGLLTGTVLRMALLRWKRGWAVGLVLATLAMGCIMLGVRLRQLDGPENLPSAYTADFLSMMLLGFLCITLGAALVWPLWTLLVQAFLPARTANILLNWQRSLSNEASGLARRDDTPLGTRLGRVD